MINKARKDIGVSPANPNQLYNGSSDELFYYFAQHNTMVELNRIYRESNHAEKKNRPLLILGFNPENNQIVITSETYKIKYLTGPHQQYLMIEFDENN